MFVSLGLLTSLASIDGVLYSIERVYSFRSLFILLSSEVRFFMLILLFSVKFLRFSLIVKLIMIFSLKVLVLIVLLYPPVVFCWDVYV